MQLFFEKSAASHLVKVLHLISIGEPRLLVLARLDHKHLVVSKHLGEAVGEDLTHVDVELVHLQLLIITMKSRVLVAAGILSNLKLMCIRACVKSKSTPALK